MKDDSWEREMADFVIDINTQRPARPGVEDAQSVLLLIEELYLSQRP